MGRAVRNAIGEMRVRRALFLLGLGAFLLAIGAVPALAEERTVVGTIVALDTANRTLTVQDGKGVKWNYIVDRDAGIDLGKFKTGDRVSVTIGRPTPLNMITAADRLRKGDLVIKIPF
jgi:hypothetical protein